MNIELTILCRYLELKPQYLKLLSERDTSDVWRKLAIWMLVDADHRVIRFTTPGSDEYHAINKVAQLYIDDCKDIQTWKTAASAAYAAFGCAIAAAVACAARDVIATLADSYPARATNAAAYAAHAAFGCAIAAYAAPADYFSAAHAACAATWALAGEEAFYDAKDNMRKKLIKLINSAPPKETT